MAMDGDWVWYLGAGVLGIGALWLFVWAWWGDRSRGRVRCGRCWYSMEGLLSGEGSPLPACPECGWVGKRSGQFYKSRRRWGCVVLALLVAVGAVASGLTPKVRRDGVWSVTPTWVMWSILATPYRSVPFEDELAERITAGAGADSAVARLYAREPRLRLTRGEWVRGVPLRCSSFAAFGSAVKGGGGLTLTPARVTKNDADLSFYPQSHENWWQPSKVLVDPRSVLPGGDVDLMWTAPSRKSWSRLTGLGRVRLVESIDEMMRPVEVSGEAFLSCLSPRIFVLPTTDRLALSVRELPPAHAGEVVGCRVELRVDGVVVARGRWYQSNEEPMNARPVHVQFLMASVAPLENGDSPQALSHYLAMGATVRFSADIEMALCPFECVRYWKMNFEVPLREVVR